MNAIEPDVIDPDPNRTERPDLMALYEDALREPPSLSTVDLVEFLHAREHRFGGGSKRPTRCCRSRRGIRCPFCHPEDYI